MSGNINVDPEILEEFANSLAQFQDTLEAELQSLNSEWSRCSETFSGKQKDAFAENFDITCQVITQAVETGRNAAEQLKRYQDAVRQALD
jgi:WXG100 family type VII secretion target